MDVVLKKVKVKDLVEGFIDDGEDGVTGYGGNLDIRPPYQRDFVYDPPERDAVIDTVFKGYPLNTMYWAVREDGTYEVIDGQQRTMSIALYCNNDFSCLVDGTIRGETNLTNEQRKRLLEYELTVYLCSGTEEDKLNWFKTVNIAGKELSQQELRNAAYAGSWVNHAKRIFSKMKGPAQDIGGKYLSNRAANRQEILETALFWITSGGDQAVRYYMDAHQQDENANDLWQYFRDVIEWIERVFINRKNRIKYMRHNEWGKWYNEYKDVKFDAAQVEQSIKELIVDQEVERKSGIYPYILTGEERYLNLRTFSDDLKLTQYEMQDCKCNSCKEEFNLDEMEADHIVPWSDGGKTKLDNCQMLCKKCHYEKSAL